MNTVTRGFSELSKEVMSCIAFWKELGLSAIATILSQLQVQEKEKLELVRVYVYRGAVRVSGFVKTLYVLVAL